MRACVSLLGAMVLAGGARAEPVPLQEKPGHVTEATMTVDATPAQVYALVTDYTQWPAVLSDVSNVVIERPGRETGRVQFRSKALEHQVTVEFDNQPDRAVRFKGMKGPPGGRASGSYVLEPIDGGRHTRIVASLYLDVVGVTGMLVSGSEIRRMRQAKLRVDLEDLSRALARAPRA